MSQAAVEESQAKFTKGPWLAGGTTCSADEKEKALRICKESIDLTSTGSGYFMEVYIEDGLRIAICGHGPNGINNANLIAAAPDLYEALIELADAVYKNVPNENLTPLLKGYEMAQQALIKARGEKP